jgi:hypothetical protein
VVYAPAERADTLPLFLLYPYMNSVMELIRASRLENKGPIIVGLNKEKMRTWNKLLRGGGVFTLTM